MLHTRASALRVLWPQLLGALSFRLGAFVLMTVLALWNEQRPAPTLPDLALSAIPYVPWVAKVNYLAWLCLYLPLSIALLTSEPQRWIRYMVTGGLLSIARGVCIALTGLGVPDPSHTTAGIGNRSFMGALIELLSPWAIFAGGDDRAHLTKDLFFSGHTATTFLLLLYLWHRPRLRVAALAAHVIVVVTVLFAHLHYAIDIAAAYAFTFALFAAREWRPAGMMDVE